MLRALLTPFLILIAATLTHAAAPLPNIQTISIEDLDVVPGAPKYWRFYRNNAYQDYVNTHYIQSIVDNGLELTHLPVVTQFGIEVVNGEPYLLWALTSFHPDLLLQPIVLSGELRIMVDPIHATTVSNRIAGKNLPQVYEDFTALAQRQGRLKFSHSFVEALANEDRTLPAERNQYIAIQNNREDPLATDPVSAEQMLAFVGLFDASPIKGRPDHLTPVEHKRDFVLPVKNKIEIRRFDPRAFNPRHVTRIIGEHLAQMGKLNYLLVVHTDSFGRDIFTSRRYGFTENRDPAIRAQLPDDEFLLTMSAAEFYWKHVPDKIKLQTARFMPKFPKKLQKRLCALLLDQ